MPTPMQAAIMSSGALAAYVDMWFAANTYRVAGVTTGDLPLVSGFTFTGASLRTMFDSTGAMTYGPNNLCLQSQTFGTTWSQNNGTVSSDSAVAPDGTTTADSWVASSSTNAYIRQSITTLAGTTFVGSVYIKAAVNSWALVEFWNSGTTKWSGTYINLSTGAQGNTTSGGGGLSPTFTIASAGNGWYRLSAAVTTDNAALSMNIYLASGNGNLSVTAGNSIYLWGAQLEAVTYRTTPAAYMPTTSAAYYGPRLVYDPVTLASLGILVEEARTNLCLQSQTFDNASWTKINSVVTANAVTSPDGTTSADAMVDDTTNADHKVRQSISVTSGTVYTFSVYAKANTLNYIWLYAGTPNVGKVFNLATGAVAGNVGDAPASATITAVGNGWYRCEMTYTAGATSAQNQDIGLSVDGTTFNYVGSGQGVYLWQADFQAGTGASSPIPTTTASVTRAADIVRLTGLALAYPVSLAAGFIKNFGAATSRAVTLQIDGNNFTAMGLNSALATQLDMAQGGSFQAQITGSTPGLGVAVLEAGRAATNDVGFAAQGVLAGTDVSATMPAMPTAANIGMLSDGGSEPLNGTISRIRIYNRALSDAQLQALTA